ncbi:hypothetical protein [Cupriavidus agavae]|uniref:ThuA-like domain-containing protein n=1 Tax=Cupriavidus agavae TaxID=1001822 RepID=A0A4Q7RG23_9BURK|nr:hypothetical protein [Cupriavidus agavae]RZT30802.1 hypothetical protein EV147_4650 [Cupriavidus agavae]
MTHNVLHIRAVSHEMPAFIAMLQARGMASRSLRELTGDDLRGRSAILIEAHIDQRAMLAHRAALRTHLDAGGTLVFNGHLVYPLFDELDPYRVAEGRGVRDLIVERVHAHPVFDGVSCEDLSFRRGVAGFYGRGANPAPSGAVVLHRLRQDGSPLDWVWRRPGGGQIFMHGGNSCWMYVGDQTSAARIAPQLLDWIEAGAPAMAHAPEA